MCGRLVLIIIGLLLAAGAPLTAQVGPAFTCTSQAGVPPTVRAEGVTELVGDTLLNCTGGIPTPPGAPVPLVNVQLFLNTNITSRTVPVGAGQDPRTEALLLIGDPVPGNQAAAPPALSPLIGVGGLGINYGVPGAASNGGQVVPNVFQGLRISDNSLIWQGVPFDPPGTTVTRVIRIKNVRANANALGLSSAFIPTQVVGFTSITGTSPIQINNPQQTLAFVQQGLQFSAREAISNKDCTNLNANPALPSCSNCNRAARLRYEEFFQAVFRTRTAGTSASNPTATTPQNIPGMTPVTESGFYSSELFFAQTGDDPVQARGLAGFGTRLRAEFNNVPTGVRIFVSNSGINSGPDAATVRRVSSAGSSGTLIGAPSGVSEVPLTNGRGEAVFEIFGADPTRTEQVEIGVYPSYTATGILGDIGVGTAQVTGGLAGPLSNNPTDLPQFAAPTHNGSAFNLFSIEPCPSNPPAFNLGLSQPPLNFTQQGGAQLPGTSPPYLNLLIPTTTTPVQNLREEATIQTFSPAQGNPAAAGWLTAILSQTTTPATVTVTANPTGLSPGTYNGTVRVASTSAVNGPLSYPVRLIVPAPGPVLQPFDAAHAASYARGEVAAGEAVVFFGQRFGPPALATLELANGAVTTRLGETRVLFDNVAAPMIYAVDRQVAAFAPFSIAGKQSTQVEIEYRGVKSPPVTLTVSPAVPGLFTADNSGTGQAAALNQDGSFNNADTPAEPGGIVVFFGAGGGQTNPGGRDGRLAGDGAPLGQFTQPVTAAIDRVPAEVLYGGPAPGLVEGVLQANVRIPPNAATGNLSVVISVGGKPTQFGVTVAVRRR